MSDWKSRLLEFAAERGVEQHDTSLGVGIGFSDGCDVFWVLPGEVFSTVPCPASGPEPGRDLIAEYEAIDRVRSQVIHALRHHLAERGLRVDRCPSGCWRARRYELDVGATLTMLAREKQDVAHALGEVLKRGFAGKVSPKRVARYLGTPLPPANERGLRADDEQEHDAPVREPPEKKLQSPAPHPGTGYALLVELTAERIAALDAFAEKTLAEFLRQEDVLWKYSDRNYYDPAIDTWCTMDDWVAIAERRLDSSKYVDPSAVRVLIDADDPRAADAARRYIADCDLLNENIDESDVAVVWHYRHENPDVAREWFVGYEEGIPFCEERAALGDPVALRHIGKSNAFVREIFEDDEFPDVEALRALGPADRQKVRERLLQWASTDHRFSPPNAEFMQAALVLDLPEVAAALQTNPHVLPGLLTTKRQADQFDEPGLLMSPEFLLAWSRLAPSEYLARLLLTARETGLVGMAEEASRRNVEGSPDLAEHLDLAFSAYRKMMNDLEPVLAIAWTRCRSKLAGE